MTSPPICCRSARSCATSCAGELQSQRLPYLRRVIQIDGDPDVPGIASWPTFLELAARTPEQLVNAMAAEIAPADLAMVFFSSGTTGKPKGVMQTHRAAAIQCWRPARILGLQGDVRTWSANGLFWSGNFAMGMGATFAVGGSLVLQRYFVPGEALQLMAAEKVTYPMAWPHQWARLEADPWYLTVDLSTLRYVGETSPLRRHPTVHTDWNEPVSAYGNSETLTLSAAHPSGTAAQIREGNHGFPLPGNTMRIVDPLTGSLLPLGETGEIAVKGPTLMLGYLKTPLRGGLRRGRVLPHRRRRFHRRGGVPALAWSAQRHHQDGRGERVAAGNRCGAGGVSRCEGGEDGRGAARDAGRNGRGLRGRA
jgi:fatty-acyl-CoA synthase